MYFILYIYFYVEEFNTLFIITAASAVFIAIFFQEKPQLLNFWFYVYFYFGMRTKKLTAHPSWE